MNTPTDPFARFLRTLLCGGAPFFLVFLSTGDCILPATSDQPSECNDQWTPTTTSDAPTGRSDHTGVWTGGEMIVWGGSGDTGFSNTGGRYNPSTNSWTATTTTNA